MKPAAEVGALLTMRPDAYYEGMKKLARQVRGHYGLVSPRVRFGELQEVYRDQGIQLTLWPGEVRNLRGAYFNDEVGVSVMVMKELPEDARLFTMAHELKHHLVDAGLKPFSDWTFRQSSPIEAGANLFAAELIYPEKDFQCDLERLRGRTCDRPLDVLLCLKKKTRTTLPYRILRERAVSMGFARASAFVASWWRELEEANW